MTSIPFKIPVGLEAQGIVRFEPPTVILEVVMWEWRSLSKRMKEYLIPIQELTAVRLKDTFFQLRLELQLRSIRGFGDIPTTTPGTIRLHFPLRHREEVRELASSLSMRLSEYRLDQWEQEIHGTDE
jgi:hypothetical protein